MILFDHCLMPSFQALQAHSSFLLTKKLENESVVSRQTALVLRNLDGRHSPLTTQGTDRYRKETQGTEVGTQVLAKAAVRTTRVESPVTYPSDLHIEQLRLEDMKVGESQVPKTSMYLDQSISRIRYMYPIIFDL